MALKFDSEKSFEFNFVEFRAHLEALDPECAKILFDNLETLLGDGEPSRARARSAAFNAKVAGSLASFLQKNAGT
jgi:hypothetical protein